MSLKIKVKDVLIRQIAEMSVKFLTQIVEIYICTDRGQAVTQKKIENLHEQAEQLALLTGDLAK